MSPEHAAYLSGWRASRRGRDMDAGEDRYLSRSGQPWGSKAHDEFLRGWIDYAADNPYSPSGEAR